MRIIGGRLGGRVIKVIDSPGLRPATGRVREALFSMLAARGALFHGARTLDCYAGAGSVGIEALSRGAGKAVFIERSPAVAKVLRDNLRGLGLGPDVAQVVEADVLVEPLAACPAVTSISSPSTRPTARICCRRPWPGSPPWTSSPRAVLSWPRSRPAWTCPRPPCRPSSTA